MKPKKRHGETHDFFKKVKLIYTGKYISLRVGEVEGLR